jgi:hypothetical protein
MPLPLNQTHNLNHSNIMNPQWLLTMVKLVMHFVAHVSTYQIFESYVQLRILCQTYVKNPMSNYESYVNWILSSFCNISNSP